MLFCISYFSGFNQHFQSPNCEIPYFEELYTLKIINMKIIPFEDIAKLNIAPALCLQWVKVVFIHKYECKLPAKISIKMVQYFHYHYAILYS